MAVYIFTAPDIGLFKVGFAANVERRLKHAQTMCPSPLILAARRDGSRWTEACLHRHFSSLHYHGEWFRLVGDVVTEFLNFEEPLHPSYSAPQSFPREWVDHPIRAYRTAKNIQLKQLAEMIGISAASLSRIEQRKQNPHLVLLLKIKEACNNEISLDEFPAPISESEADAASDSLEEASQ